MSAAHWNNPQEAQQYGVSLLSSDRIRLRPTTEQDLVCIERWWSDPAWEPLQQLIVRPRPAAPTVEMFRTWSQNSGNDLGAGFSVITLDSDEVIGHVVLHGRFQPARIATFAIVLSPDHVGRGLGTEATRLMVRYGFEELGLHKIELQVWSYNTRAIRSYEKAGFVIEGERRAAAFHAGTFHGETQMGILLEEYQQLPPGPS